MSKKISFRGRADVQDDVRRWAISEKPVSDLTSFLQDKYGKAYRKQNILADMRAYQEKFLDEEKARRSVPRKYRKEPDPREHLLIYMKKTTGFSSPTVLIRPENLQPFEKELERFRKLYQEEVKSGGSRKKIYYKVEMIVGNKNHLLDRLEMAQTVNIVVAYSLLLTSDSSRVLNVLSQFNINSESTIPWIFSLQNAGLSSKVSSFQKLTKKVLS